MSAVSLVPPFLHLASTRPRARGPQASGKPGWNYFLVYIGFGKYIHNCRAWGHKQSASSEAEGETHLSHEDAARGGSRAAQEFDLLLPPDMPWLPPQVTSGPLWPPCPGLPARTVAESGETVLWGTEAPRGLRPGQANGVFTVPNADQRRGQAHEFAVPTTKPGGDASAGGTGLAAVAVLPQDRRSPMRQQIRKFLFCFYCKVCPGKGCSLWERFLPFEPLGCTRKGGRAGVGRPQPLEMLLRGPSCIVACF